MNASNPNDTNFICAAARKLIEGAIDNQSEKELIYKTMEPINYLKEYCTISLKSGRQAGHSTAAVQLATKPSNKSEHSHVLLLRFLQKGAIKAPKVFACKLAKTSNIGNKLTSARGMQVELVIVDNASMLSAKQLKDLRVELLPHVTRSHYYNLPFTLLLLD